MKLLVPFALHKNYHCDGSIVIFDGFWMKTIFTQISSCITVLNLGKNMVSPTFISNVMLMFGYYDEFKFVQRQILCHLF